MKVIIGSTDQYSANPSFKCPVTHVLSVCLIYTHWIWVININMHLQCSGHKWTALNTSGITAHLHKSYVIYILISSNAVSLCTFLLVRTLFWLILCPLDASGDILICTAKRMQPWVPCLSFELLDLDVCSVLSVSGGLWDLSCEIAVAPRLHGNKRYAQGHWHSVYLSLLHTHKLLFADQFLPDLSVSK